MRKLKTTGILIVGVLSLFLLPVAVRAEVLYSHTIPLADRTSLVASYLAGNDIGQGLSGYIFHSNFTGSVGSICLGLDAYTSSESIVLDVYNMTGEFTITTILKSSSGVVLGTKDWYGANQMSCFDFTDLVFASSTRYYIASNNLNYSGKDVFWYGKEYGVANDVLYVGSSDVTITNPEILDDGADNKKSKGIIEINSGPAINTTTRIIDFDPQDGEVINIGGAATGTVPFNLHAYINEDDIGNFLSIKVIFRNVDQNSLANGTCGPLDFGLMCSRYSFDLFRGIATTSGDFLFSSTTIMAKGNYRVEASLDTATTFLGVNLGFFTSLGAISDVKNHQFIVGSSTFIGNLSQTIFSQTDSFFASLPATTTSALAAQCNPLAGNFGIRECMAFLFIPDANALKNTFEQFRDGVLVKAPWGYLTRFVVIISATTTTALPDISYNFGPKGPLANVVWNISPSDMLAGGASLLASTTDHNGNTIRDVLEPLVKLIVGLALVFGIVTDLTGSHGNSFRNDRNKGMS